MDVVSYGRDEDIGTTLNTALKMQHINTYV